MVVIDNSWNGTRPVLGQSYTLPSGVNFRTGPEPRGYNITGFGLFLLQFSWLHNYRLALISTDKPYGDPTGDVIAEAVLYMPYYYTHYYAFDAAALGAIAQVDLEPETYYNLRLFPDPATVWPYVSGWTYALGPYDVAGGFEASNAYPNPESVTQVYQLSAEPIAPPPPRPAVPAPLPLLGLPTAFAWARRLRASGRAHRGSVGGSEVLARLQHARADRITT